TGNNQFKYNYGDGLEIDTHGSVTLNNLAANFSINGFGAYITNTAGTGTVTLTGASTFIGNYNDGLDILSNGNVTLASLTATQNSPVGVGGHGVYVDNSTASGKSVTLNGVNVLNGNYLEGVNILSKGAVILNNITADNSTLGFGVIVDNCQWS